MNILVSACLIGLKCRYNAITTICADLDMLKNEHNLIPVCPEIFGGMPTPREPCEIKNNVVLNKSGEDVTDFFKNGAEETLKLAQFYDCKFAILKERSPSCGCGKIYDGSFTGKLISGNGITAQVLLDNNIKVIGESQIKDYFNI